jgi:regulator of sigma D
MLEQCTIKERWSGVNEIIDRWLYERQLLIVQFCALSGVHEFSSKTDHSHLRLQKFCQLLTDYVSAGHFEVYYQLIREAEEFKDGSEKLAQSLLPSITATTETVIAFTDKYVEAEGPFTNLSQNLSKLGETLASRFEYEDRLIDVMHEAHRELVA